MQVLFKSRHRQASDLRDLTERRVRFVLRLWRRGNDSRRMRQRLISSKR